MIQPQNILQLNLKVKYYGVVWAHGSLTHEAENGNIHSLNMNGILRGAVF